jgi:hypothetical protein
MLVQDDGKIVSSARTMVYARKHIPRCTNVVHRSVIDYLAMGLSCKSKQNIISVCDKLIRETAATIASVTVS